MASKKKNNKKKNNTQEYFDFPEYEKVTPEVRELINKIPNPFLISYLIGFLSLFVGIGFLIMTRFVSGGLINIYFEIFGYAGIVFGLGEFYFTIRKNLAFNKFKKEDQYRIIWVYNQEKYEEFYKGLQNSDSGINLKRLGITCGVILFLAVLLYFSMNEQSRFTAIPFGLVCIGIVIITSYVIPETYLLDANRKPYITLLNDNAAYALGRFYRWEKALIKFRTLDERYGNSATEMRITYQEKSLFGKKTPTFEVLIPENSKYTLQYARRVAKRINKERKLLNENPEQNEDFMDKAFKQMLGRE